MLKPINHVGYLALDLEAAIREYTETFGLRVVRRFDRPQFSLLGAHLGTEEVSQMEVFTFTDSHLLPGDVMRPVDSDPSAHIMKSEAETGSQTVVLR